MVLSLFPNVGIQARARAPPLVPGAPPRGPRACHGGRDPGAPPAGTALACARPRWRGLGTLAPPPGPMPGCQPAALARGAPWLPPGRGGSPSALLQRRLSPPGPRPRACHPTGLFTPGWCGGGAPHESLIRSARLWQGAPQGFRSPHRARAHQLRPKHQTRSGPEAITKSGVKHRA